MKKAVGFALLAFAALSIAFAVFKENRPAPQTEPKPAAVETAKALPAPKPTAKAAPKPQPAKQIVIARYCHGHARCSNCLKIEQYSRETIETGFRKELDSGRLKFEVVNVEEPANRHYIQDYGLYTKSLVLVAEAGGKEARHNVLNGVWDHLSDKDAFMSYVRTETESFLK